jgi:hypothetical protein
MRRFCHVRSVPPRFFARDLSWFWANNNMLRIWPSTTCQCTQNLRSGRILLSTRTYLETVAAFTTSLDSETDTTCRVNWQCVQPMQLDFVESQLSLIALRVDPILSHGSPVVFKLSSREPCKPHIQADLLVDERYNLARPPHRPAGR